MIIKSPLLKITTAYPYLNDEGDITLFNQSLQDTSKNVQTDTPLFFNLIVPGYSRWFNFEYGDIDKNLIYKQDHNGRYHLLFRGLKYYLNVSDVWYMTALFAGSNPTQPFGKDLNGVPLQSFANINLGVDAMYLAMQSILPLGSQINEGLFESNEQGIRIIVFVDKLEVVERTVGTTKVKNLQFHFTLRAHLIDQSMSSPGQYSDFTETSLLSQKSFYYEQTIPTYKRSTNQKKTGWGHFLYPLVETDDSVITYFQLSDVLKTIYNGMLFSQSTDNASIQVDSSSLLKWIKVDETLKNASHGYAPTAVTALQAQPAFAFTEKDILKDWLADVVNIASTRGSTNLDFILSYDNIYWEPFADVFSGDIYSNSPGMFMTRLTTPYNGKGQSPMVEPGMFENPGGFIKARRKYFISNLIQTILSPGTGLTLSVEKGDISPYLTTSQPDRFMGPKFFPFFKFKQYKNNTTGKELLDVIEIPFSGSTTTQNIIECDTSISLKALSDYYRNKYTKNISTYPNRLPIQLGTSTTERINSIGYVEYVNDDGTSQILSIDLNLASSARKVFGFLTWPFTTPRLLGDASHWTRSGRYQAGSANLSAIILGADVSTWRSLQGGLSIGLCELLESGMYDTPEIAYKEYYRVILKSNALGSTPNPTDPTWSDFYKCIPEAEIIETTEEYCDPSPSPDGRRILQRIKKQRMYVTTSGTKIPAGDPTYEYPATTVVLKNQTRVVNGIEVLGDVTTVYKDCEVFSERFVPYPISPTGPTGPTSQSTRPVITTGPNGKKKREVDLTLEDFINPAVFKVNTITITPSKYVIPLVLNNCYYKIEFDPDTIGDSSNDYTITLFPGTRGQIVILDVNTISTKYKGIRLLNKTVLASGKSSQRVHISTDVWGDGDGQPVKSILFLIYDGNDWIEFLRRDIY